MKPGDIKRISGPWFISKFKRRDTMKAYFNVCFGDDEQTAQTGPVHYSQHQAKKDIYRLIRRQDES